MGEPDGKMSQRLQRIADTFNQAGIEAIATPEVVKAIWSKLALNVCTLPTTALLRFFAPQLVQHSATLELMQALFREAVSVARAQNVAWNFEELWAVISGLSKRRAATT